MMGQDFYPEKGRSGRPVRLEITGRQKDPEGIGQEQTAVYEARCLRCGGGYRFLYREGEEDICLYLSPGISRIEKEKSGTCMVFDPAVSATQCLYVTPFGTIPMEIRTQRIVLMGDGENTPLRARIKYTLCMGADHMQTCSVTIAAQGL